MQDSSESFRQGYAQGIEETARALRKLHVEALADIGRTVGSLVERMNVLSHRLQEAEALVERLERKLRVLAPGESVFDEDELEDESTTEIVEELRPTYAQLVGEAPVLPTQRRGRGP